MVGVSTSAEGTQVGHAETNPYQPYDFAAANEHYVKNVFDKSFVTVGARSRVGIITCCDARCIPEHFFEMKENEAFVIRNGGGRTTSDDVIRTLLIIQILSEIRELKVIHHTDCGSLAFTEQWIRDMVRENDHSAIGGPFKDGATAYAEALSYLPFTRKTEGGETEREQIERSVVQDVHYLRNHRLIKESIKITGYVFDLQTGKVEEVEC